MPAAHRRSGVAGRQSGAQFQLATRLRRRLRLAWVLAQQLSFQQQKRAVEGLQQGRFIRAEDQHGGKTGVYIDTLEQVTAVIERAVGGDR
ncbi:hypothetical protein D3C80_1525600 [compost metagenome]